MSIDFNDLIPGTAVKEGMDFDDLIPSRQEPKTVLARPIAPGEFPPETPPKEPVGPLPSPQFPGGTPEDLGPSAPMVAYQRQLEKRKEEIQEKEAVERFYQAHPEKRPRKYKNFINNMVRSGIGMTIRGTAGGIGTLASISESAIWDKDQLERWAQKLYQTSKKPAFTPAEGGGWRGFVAASIGQAAPYMAAAVGATLLTGTPLGAFGVGYAVEGDEAYRRTIELGGSEEDAQMRRFIVGTINAGIEALQVSRVMKFAKAGRGSAKGILNAATDRAWKKVLKQGGKLTYESAKHSAAEALEEVLQETTQIVSEAKYNPEVWDQATQRILMSGLGGGVVGLLLGGGGRVMTNMRAKAEAGKLTPQQLEVMNQTKSEYDAIVAEGGIGSKQKAEEVIRRGQGKLAALEGEEVAAEFEAEIAEMDAELREIQRPARREPVTPEKPPAVPAEAVTPEKAPAVESKIQQTVYHGTDAVFKEFDKAKMLDKEGLKLGLGMGKGTITFSTSKGEAQKYGKNIVEAKVNIKKPFVIKGPEWADMGYERWKRVRDGMKDTTTDIYWGKYKTYAGRVNSFVRQLKKEGYDGIILGHPKLEKDLEITVFDTSQIIIKAAPTPAEAITPEKPPIVAKEPAEAKRALNRKRREETRQYAESLKEIGLDLGVIYGPNPANPRDRKSALMLLDAIDEYANDNISRASEITKKVRERTEKASVYYQSLAGQGVGPKPVKKGTRSQRVQDTIWRIAVRFQKKLEDLTPTPAEATVKKPAKEPWEKDWPEYVKLWDKYDNPYVFAEKVGKQLGIKSQAGQPLYRGYPEGETKPKWLGESGSDSRERWHKAIIRQAIGKGKPVPAEVLAEYPDLAPTPAAPPVEIDPDKFHDDLVKKWGEDEFDKVFFDLAEGGENERFNDIDSRVGELDEAGKWKEPETKRLRVEMYKIVEAELEKEEAAPPVGKATEVKAKVPEGEISRRPVTVEGKKYYPIALPTDQIGVDAAKFQFKLGAKLVGGVTEALKGVEKFDPVKGGQILVWQDKAGKYWVVDGHHRVALARKTGAETLETWVVSEKDGVTEQDARAIGALRNLADGKGTAVDAAKLFRDSDITLTELRKNAVPTESTVVQQGLDMADLSDEVFRLVIDERLPANMAATIGKQVKNPTQQKQVADLILEGEVETLRQAELLAATIDSAPVLTKTEQTLFGLETTEKSLYAERARILANVEKKLKTNKKVFGVLATQTGIIEAKGNILAKVENLATKEKAEEVLFMLEKLANTKGPIAEALNDATKQYAENPTKENLTKVTSELLEKWTEGPGRLRIPERERVPELPLERAAPKVKALRKPTSAEIAEFKKLKDDFSSQKFNIGSPQMKRLIELEYIVEQKQRPKSKPGFIDVTPLEKSLKASLKLVEPAKITQRAFGRKPGAIIIKGIHQADVGRIEFNEAEIEALDSSLEEFGEKLSRYSNKVLKNLMAARGKPVGKGAILIKNEALKALAKEAPELVGTRKMITKIADHNYKYLQSVVGDDIHYVEDYFYGIYKDTEDATVENFLDYWHTTDRFTKQKKLPTVADAIAYGLELRDYNPLNNLRSEYMAIARLDGMIYMRDELMRTGKGRYIDTKEEAPHDWEKLKEPVFKDVRVHPEAAVMIKSLLSTNKLRRGWFPRGLTHINNALRTLKFVFSMFHQLNIVKQSIADEGYLKFLQPSALRSITRGFKKNDPIFRTPAYKDYIRHGGGHRYSIESQAQRAFSNFVESLDKRLGFAFKAGALPIRIPKAYVKWLFQSYIPKVKYSKYLDSINRFEQKNNRTPTSVEKIEILKEQQNFYGMMNERLFGRSGTVTSLMRLWYMSPGYFEGDFRTILKSVLQWGGKEGYKASRSRSNIINSLILSAIAATATTLALTGKPPKKPETKEDLRDLFKGDTGKVDDKGRKIMVDFLTYDRDYWNILGQALIGKPDKAAEAIIKRSSGMVAPSAQVALDIANIAAGRALVDWKNDRITEITDPFARKVLKIAIHEIKRTEPISVGVYGQSRRRGQTAVLSALTALLGVRPTLTEKDKREQEVLHRIYSLKGQQEKLYQYLGGLRNPRNAVEKYNKTVKTILDSPMTPKSMKKEWEPKLIIDIDKYLMNKVHYLSMQNRTEKEVERAKKILKGFGVTPEQAQEYFNKYYQQERKVTVGPLEKHPVIGRNRKRKRLVERMK